MTAKSLQLGDRVTAQMLREERACKSDVKRFEAEWPDGATLNETTILRAAALHFDLGWFVQHFLTAQLPAYDKARAEARALYEKARAEAWAVYEKATAEARAVYEKARPEAWAVYDKAEAEAWAVYEKATAEPRAVYDKAEAEAWAVYEKATAEILISILQNQEPD